MAEMEKNPEITEETADIETAAEYSELSPEEQDEMDAVSEYNDTAAQIEEMETKLSEAEDNYRRLFAEFDNFRKRTSKEKTEAFGNASAKCIENILPVIDSFERAVEAECSDEGYKNGMLMIFNQFVDILGKMDVKEIPSLGEDFDPNVHNAIQKADSDEYESGKICQVYQKGYKMGERLIRPAMVAVAN